MAQPQFSETYKKYYDVVDVNNPTGISGDWSTVKRAVCVIFFKDADGKTVGSASGVLINNSLMDGTTYILTNIHVREMMGIGSSVSFNFNYETSATEERTINYDLTDQTESGNLVSSIKYENGDLTLFQLDKKPDWDNVYYAGWNCTPLVDQEDYVTCIHHGCGQSKQIAQQPARDYADSRVVRIGVSQSYEYQSGAYNEGVDYEIGKTYNSCKQRPWEVGETCGGSSGSPIFDDDQRARGLFYASALVPIMDYDEQDGSLKDTRLERSYRSYHVLFASYWNVEDEVRGTTLKQFLDPCGAGLMYLDGISYDNPANAAITSVDCMDYLLVAEDYADNADADSYVTFNSEVDYDRIRKYGIFFSKSEYLKYMPDIGHVDFTDLSENYGIKAVLTRNGHGPRNWNDQLPVNGENTEILLKFFTYDALGENNQGCILFSGYSDFNQWNSQILPEWVYRTYAIMYSHQKTKRPFSLQEGYVSGNSFYLRKYSYPPLVLWLDPLVSYFSDNYNSTALKEELRRRLARGSMTSWSWVKKTITNLLSAFDSDVDPYVGLDDGYDYTSISAELRVKTGYIRTGSYIYSIKMPGSMDMNAYQVFEMDDFNTRMQRIIASQQSNVNGSSRLVKEQAALVPQIIPDSLVLTIYPNPTDRYLDVHLEMLLATSSIDFKVSNLAGKELLQETFSVNTTSMHHQLDLGDFTDGVYLLKISGENGFSIERKIILKR